jgi:hypothetical protein
MWIPSRKQWKNKELEHAPWLAALWKGRRVCWSFEMGLGRINKLQLLTWTYTKSTQRWLVHTQGTFGARTSHGQLELTRLTAAWTWGKAAPSPLYYTLCLSTSHEAHIQMTFCLETPKWESRNCQSWDSHDFEGP